MPHAQRMRILNKGNVHCASRSVHVGFLLLYINLEPTFVCVTTHWPLREGAVVGWVRADCKPRLRVVVLSQPACVQLDLVDDRCNLLLLFAVLRATCIS